jgi:hypothetical protein
MKRKPDAKLPALPQGEFPCTLLCHGDNIDVDTDETAGHYIEFAIGRPVMQETQAGELVASMILTPQAALLLAGRLIRQARCVFDHIEAGDCDACDDPTGF